MLRFSFAGFSNQTASNFYKPEKSISEIWPYFSTAVLDNEWLVYKFVKSYEQTKFINYGKNIHFDIDGRFWKVL